MSAKEKVAYLKGLIDGLGLDEDDKQTKIFKALVDITSELADNVVDLKEESAVLFDAVSSIDEDLRAVEEIFEEDDDDDDDCDCGHHHHHGHHHGHSHSHDDHDHHTIYETACPACGEVINLDESMLSVGEIKCPSCGENLEFGFDDDEEEDIIAIETDKKIN